MGLFDHLFKPRPDDSVERVVEAPMKASALVRIPEGEGEFGPDPAAAFLQPKGYGPGSTDPAHAGQKQGFVPVLPSAKRAPPPERRIVPPEAPAATSGQVVLTVGDVLGRIPAAFLAPGPHDLKRELRFQIADLSSDLTRGRPAIALSCIAEQCPEIFLRPITDADDMAVRLPMQKLVEQVDPLRSRVSAPPPPAAPPARIARPPNAAPPVAIPPPTAHVVAPPQFQPPRLETPKVEEPIAEEPKVEEPKPEAPPLEPAPAAPPQEEPSPVTTAPPAPEPPPVEEPPQPEEIPTAVADEPPPEPEIAPPADSVPAEGMIELSLSAILARLPPELLAGDAPRLAERDRISLPFPDIERQLGTGAVSVPGKLFWSAISPLLKHHFVLREDISVSLPLEEIFQNLPVGRVTRNHRLDALMASPDQPSARETPFVLAPRPDAEPVPKLDFDRPPAPPIPAEPPQAEAPEPPVAPLVAPPEPEPPSAASAAPDENQPAFVHLQPFRAGSPPSPDLDWEAEREQAAAEAVFLGIGPVAPDPEPLPPAVEFVPAAEPPAPDPVEAFTPDEPPPLKIEEPAAAVAILRATVPSPEESPVFSAATVSVQPPQIFRPVVLAPPIAGFIATTPVTLAPTLAGTAGIATGMISLAPSADPAVRAPAPPPAPPPAPIAEPQPAPPAAPASAPPKPAMPSALREFAPTLKNFVRHSFHSSAEKPEPPPSITPPPAEPTPAPFPLPLPPVSRAAAPPPTPELAPPGLPLSRFDQHSLQSLFMTEEILDLPKVSRLSSALPGIQACVIVSQGRTHSCGNLPDGFDLAALRGLSPQVGAAADRLPIGELKNFTLYGQDYSISFFERASVCLCAIHRARSFVPGVREKLVAVVDELARG